MRFPRVLGLATAVCVAFAAAAFLLPHSPSALRELVLSLGPAAPLLAIAAWVLLTPALFPGTVLAAAGGLAFGGLGGSALTLGGAVAGGLAAFVLGRTVAKGPVEHFVRGRPRLARIHALLERRGFAAMLAARLMPGMPVAGLHYAAGASPVRVAPFAAAMALGALLRSVPYALLGQGIGSGSVPMLLVAAASIALGGMAATLLVRQLRQPAARPA